MSFIERYVRVDAAGSGDGTTDAASGVNCAFTWAEMVTDLNTPSRSGYRYNVKQGNYFLSASTTLTGDGTTSSPIVIRGYKTTPGDATLGRGSNGYIDTSNMPLVAYSNSSHRFDAGGSNYLIVESIEFSGVSSSSALLLNSGTGSITINCKATNSSSTGACIENGGNGGNIIIGCDSFTPNSVTNECISAPGSVVGCKAIGGSGGTGINLRNNASLIALNTIKGFTNGINKNTAGAQMNLWFNTIANSFSNGINYASASTARSIIVGNHITGCSGYGINLNGTTTDQVIMMNRFRDNVSGNVNGSIDWADVTRIFEVTTDTSDDLEFINPSGNDFGLKVTAPAFQKAILLQYMNIGANGSQLTTTGITSMLHPLAYTGKR